MTLDHIYTYIPNMPIWFGYVGKISAPIFFYLVVEGFIHTKNLQKYFIRLFSFGIIMIFVDLALGISNNIMLSLGLGVALMTSISYGQKTKNIYLSSGLTLVSGFLMLFTEASYYGILMILIFYLLRNNKKLLFIIYTLFSIIPVITAFFVGNVYEQLFFYDYQWMMVFAGPVLLCYNGKLGIYNAVTKWMFYAFYPLHLILIVLIGRPL